MLDGCTGQMGKMVRLWCEKLLQFLIIRYSKTKQKRFSPLTNAHSIPSRFSRTSVGVKRPAFMETIHPFKSF